MSRLPRAAQQLIEQVREHKGERSKVEPVKESLDGLGVYRTIKFTKTVGRWLAPLLAEVDDPRIASYDFEEDQTVTFVGTPLADQRVPFPLEAAEEVQKKGPSEE